MTVEYRSTYQYDPNPRSDAPPDVKPPEPPRHKRFLDRNLKWAKALLKEGIVESIKWLILGRKRQPAQA